MFTWEYACFGSVSDPSHQITEQYIYYVFFFSFFVFFKQILMLLYLRREDGAVRINFRWYFGQVATEDSQRKGARLLKTSPNRTCQYFSTWTVHGIVIDNLYGRPLFLLKLLYVPFLLDREFKFST